MAILIRLRVLQYCTCREKSLSTLLANALVNPLALYGCPAPTMSFFRGDKKYVMKLRIDVLAIGETLIDLISEMEQESLLEARSFRMYAGGQATNVAQNVAALGGTAALVARVGDDNFGAFLRHHLVVAGVQTDYVHTSAHTPTTLVVVTRSRTSPDFTVYRGADATMKPDDMPLSLLSQAAVVHTSAFALSREPSCSTILKFVEQAHAGGTLVSFDPNYHERLWDVAEEPLSLFARICPYVWLTKPSLDDCQRLFGPGLMPEAYAQKFLELGVQHVVLTMGSEGALLADASGIVFQPASRVEVVDVTGAGDSFWAGLLLAVVDGYTLHDAMRVGLAVAAIKIRQVGPLEQKIDRAALYAQLGLQ